MASSFGNLTKKVIQDVLGLRRSRLTLFERRKLGEDLLSQTSHHEEGSTIDLRTCQLLPRSHSIVCGNRGTVK